MINQHPQISNSSILESISDGVFTVDLKWKINSFNRAAEEITGISRKDAMGKLCSEVFKSSMCETECALRQTLKSGKPIINKLGYIIDAAGSRIPVSVSTAVLRDKEGKIIGGAETFRDLSEIETLRKELKRSYKMGDIISHSPAMRPILDLVPAVSSSSSTILIQGETGTGKEILARTIHNMSRSSGENFISLNCGALPDSLLESELFGYKRGAFTGADRDKPGRFALAENGTLFLDEIGEISPALQVRLLRVLQEHTYEPLGGTKTETTNARIIAATNRNLAEMVREGTFRQDLFYRINIIILELPPLRDRIEDLPLLTDHFIQKFNHLQNRAVKGLSLDAYSLLSSYKWPGNIRELENIIERAFILCRSDEIGIEHLPPNLTGAHPLKPNSSSIQTVRSTAEKQSIIEVLKKNNYNIPASAVELKIHKTTLYRKMKALKIYGKRL